MYPDSLRIADHVDIEIAKDINKSSYQGPIMWDPIKNYQYLNYQLAFPNMLNYGWPLFIRNLFSPSIISTPAISFGAWCQEMWDSKSWSETGFKIINSIKGGVTGFVHSSLKPKSHQASTYISNNYIDRHGRFKNSNPAPAITRQWEIKNNKMHDELLKNNGTIGV